MSVKVELEFTPGDVLCGLWFAIFFAWDIYQSKFISIGFCLNERGASQKFIVSTAVFVIAFIAIAVQTGKWWHQESPAEEVAMLWAIFVFFIAIHCALTRRGWHFFYPADKKLFLANPDEFIVKSSHFLSQDFKRRWREASGWAGMQNSEARESLAKNAR